MLSLANRHCYPSTNGSLHSPSRSWPSLGETSCPIARPFPAFLLLSISPPWKHSASSFKKIWLPASRLALQAEWWIEQDNNGGWWMWMEPGLLLANVHCRRRSRYPLLIVASIRCVPQGIKDASGEKSSVPELLCFRRIRINFSARLVGLATEIIVVSCDRR